jgi:hypothetical protein
VVAYGVVVVRHDDDDVRLRYNGTDIGQDLFNHGRARQRLEQEATGRLIVAGGQDDGTAGPRRGRDGRVNHDVSLSDDIVWCRWTFEQARSTN